MTYNEDEDEGFAGDPQESDGVNHGDEMGPSGSDAHRKVGDDDIAAEIDRFLKTPRFNGDICVTLSMPDTYMKKARDKQVKTWADQRDKVLNEKLQEIEEAYHKWLNSEAEERLKRMKEDSN